MGWFRPSTRATKSHYFLRGQEISLCGNWRRRKGMVRGFSSMDNCGSCEIKLENLKKAAEGS